MRRARVIGKNPLGLFIMKKTWVIVGSVLLIILLLGGAWWYLLMNGRPESLSGIPNPFGSFGGSNTFNPSQPIEENPVTGMSTTGALRKISMTPVAGAALFEQNNSTKVRFVERGTGHIFEIDPASGNNVRIANTTIPRTTEAIWSPQGSRVVIISEGTPGARRITVNTIERTDAGEYALSEIELPSNAESISFNREGNSIYYLVPTQNGSTGYVQDLKTTGRTELFTSVLRDITVRWEPEILAYTKPSGQVPGYAYRGTQFERIAGGQNGLMIIPTSAAHVISFLANGSLISYGPAPTSTPLTAPLFPEKCTADPLVSSVLWCGAPLTSVIGQYPDLWYQGVVTFNDIIWKINVHTGGLELISIPTDDVSEEIDVIDMHVNASSTMLIFTNKRDGLLWLQELPQNTVLDDAPAQSIEQTNEEE